ncbi:hypothetical protein KKI24_14560 [bacterium]|nr:hypothetical protein [bacterium]
MYQKEINLTGSTPVFSENRQTAPGDFKPRAGGASWIKHNVTSVHPENTRVMDMAVSPARARENTVFVLLQTLDRGALFQDQHNVLIFLKINFVKGPHSNPSPAGMTTLNMAIVKHLGNASMDLKYFRLILMGDNRMCGKTIIVRLGFCTSGPVNRDFQ